MIKYVHCTDCKHFRLDDEYKPYCRYENKCDINNWQGGKELVDRPHYKYWKVESD